MFKHIKSFIYFTQTFGIDQKGQMAFLVLGGFIMSFVELLGLTVILPLLSLILLPDFIQHSPFLQAIAWRTGITSSAEMAMLVGVIVTLVFVLKTLLQIFYTRQEYKILATWRVHITTRLYHAYMRSDYELFMRRSSAKMMGLITRTVPFVLNNYIARILSLINLALTAIVILLYVVYINWIISLLVFMTGAILLVLYMFIFKTKVRRLNDEVLALNEGQQVLLQQSFAGYKETMVHLKEIFFARKFIKTSTQLARTEEKLLFIDTLPPATVELSIMLLIVALFEVIIFTHSSLAQASAQIGAIVIASFRMIPVINRIINSVIVVNGSYGAIEELVGEVIHFGIDKRIFSQSKKDFIDEDSDIEPMDFTQAIDLHDLSYSYPEADDAALSHINLTIHPGDHIGITGPSGGGKSTLINILLGFLITFKGRFTVDGIPVSSQNIRSLRKIIGFVDQSDFVLDASVAENVAYGVDLADIDAGKVIESLKKAQLWDFVSTLPQGIYSFVGENGKLFSGGQRQRLAIARAFYDDLKILILDEASAALDVETEHKLFAFLETLKGSLTVIMIAHRLSTLKSCDTILFIEGGHIIDRGSFAHLYTANETFRNYIHYSQIEVVPQAEN
jgi:ABC-type multidrug transport system fused ATPase/permease subunit